MPGIDLVGVTARSTHCLMHADLTGFTRMVRRTSFQVARGRLFVIFSTNELFLPQGEGMCARAENR
jgi:hypothetical protein